MTAMPQVKANVYDMLKRDKLVLTPEALRSLEQRVLTQYGGEGKRGAYRNKLQIVAAAQKGTAEQGI